MISMVERDPTRAVPNLVGAAEAELGRYIYRRIEALMDAKPETPGAAELVYLAKIAESVEEYGEEACAGSTLAPFNVDEVIVANCREEIRVEVAYAIRLARATEAAA